MLKRLEIILMNDLREGLVIYGLITSKITLKDSGLTLIINWVENGADYDKWKLEPFIKGLK